MIQHLIGFSKRVREKAYVIILIIFLVMSGFAIVRSDESKPDNAKETSGRSDEVVLQKADKPAAKNTQEILSTVGFRGPITAIPKWSRVLDEMKKSDYSLSRHLATGAGGESKRWLNFASSISSLSRKDKIDKVNKYFNKWQYRTDMDAYGMPDYWATPLEFVINSGDCEDYSIIKYFALRELGFSPDDLRIVIVRDTIRGIAHAIIVVFDENTVWLLDNQTDLLLTQERYSHYLAQYSINENFRWSHVPIQKKNTSQGISPIANPILKK